MADWFEVGKMVFNALRPREDPDPRIQLAWRRAVAGAIMSIIGVGLVGFFWMQGFIPGISGVALAAELQKTEQRITAKQGDRLGKLEFRVQTLEATQRLMLLGQIQDSFESQLRNQCTAIARGNQDALDAANARLADLRKQINALGTAPLPEPGCSTILISPTGK